MDPKRVAPEEKTGLPPRMRKMMEEMCGPGAVDPFARCREMMASLAPAAETGAGATPEPSTPPEAGADTAGDEGRSACRAPESCCPPKRT